jgi:hypothetical protein
LAIECCRVSGRTVEDEEDSSSELGLSLSGVSTPSSTHAARSRAIDSWAIGEAERYEVLNGDRAMDPLLLGCALIGRGGVDMMKNNNQEKRCKKLVNRLQARYSCSIYPATTAAVAAAVEIAYSL